MTSASYPSLDAAFAALVQCVTLQEPHSTLVNASLGRFAPRVSGGGFYWQAAFTRCYGNTARLTPDGVGDPPLEDSLAGRITLCVDALRTAEEHMAEAQS